MVYFGEQPILVCNDLRTSDVTDLLSLSVNWLIGAKMAPFSDLDIDVELKPYYSFGELELISINQKVQYFHSRH